MITNKINFRFIVAMEDCIRKYDLKTQTAFCELMGFERSRIPKIKSGTITINAEKAIQLSEIFGISLNWLFLNKGEMYLPNYTPKISRKKNKSLQ